MWIPNAAGGSTTAAAPSLQLFHILVWGHDPRPRWTGSLARLATRLCWPATRRVAMLLALRAKFWPNQTRVGQHWLRLGLGQRGWLLATGAVALDREQLAQVAGEPRGELIRLQLCKCQMVSTTGSGDWSAPASIPPPGCGAGVGRTGPVG
jgi:hypothetical protein